MVQPRQRSGFTLLELMAVMAVIIILGAVLVPTLTGTKGNTHTQAGADVMHASIAKSRAKAIEHGRPYRLMINAEGTEVKVEPDLVEGADSTDDNGDPLDTPDPEKMPDGVKVVLQADEDVIVSKDDAGWQRVATFLHDGTCREDNVVIQLLEQGTTPLLIRLRGITGATSKDTRGGQSP